MEQVNKADESYRMAHKYMLSTEFTQTLAFLGYSDATIFGTGQMITEIMTKALAAKNNSEQNGGLELVQPANSTFQWQWS